GHLLPHARRHELLALPEAHDVHVVLREQADAPLRLREPGVSGEDERATALDLDLFDVLEGNVRAEPGAKVGGTSGAVRPEEAPEDLPQRVCAPDALPTPQPTVRSDERHLVPLRRPLTEVADEEREARAEAGLVRLPDAPNDRVHELFAEERLAARGVPDGCTQLGNLLGADRGVQHAGRVGPRRKLVARRARREPQRQLVGGMKMERAAQRPRLPERPLAPECVTDVLLRDSVDARGELQLGGRLHLRMDAARLARDVDERRGALRQRAAREPARAHLLPGQKNRRRSTSLPPVSHQNRPRSMIWTCAAEGSSSACSSRYFTSQLRTASEASSVVTRSPSTRSAYFGINRRPPLSERRFRCRHPRRGHWERRAADVVEPELVAERDRLRPPAVLAADPGLQAGLRRSAALNADAHQLADTVHVERLEGVVLEDAVLEIEGQELALRVVAHEAQRRLPASARHERDEGRVPCAAGRADAAARELDHRAAEVLALGRLLLRDLHRQITQPTQLLVEGDEGMHDLDQRRLPGPGGDRARG